MVTYYCPYAINRHGNQKKSRFYTSMIRYTNIKERKGNRKTLKTTVLQFLLGDCLAFIQSSPINHFNLNLPKIEVRA